MAVKNQEMGEAEKDEASFTVADLKGRDSHTFSEERKKAEPTAKTQKKNIFGICDVGARLRLDGLSSRFSNGILGFRAEIAAPPRALGGNDLTFTWDWGDGIPATATIHYNDGAGPDPYLSLAGHSRSPPQTHAFILTRWRGHSSLH